MLFIALGVDKNIINEYNHKLIKIRPEDTIHVVHEYCWGICHTEWHHYILVVSITRSEGCLLDVFFLYPNLMVSRP
ncbi:hypothetical protein VIGAN_UM037800 [Vigna angularis var. angularis]|uniref:Uncharacterized protein n=1 Tax=Vigna angularis var. angularis TaxID=157739 RepID=A0A0S3TDJ7_PHAAN|nr:hypothetical protein VIGAN_UM037800 [Vigna angularis var. angularis]